MWIQYMENTEKQGKQRQQIIKLYAVYTDSHLAFYTNFMLIEFQSISNSWEEST